MAKSKAPGPDGTAKEDDVQRRAFPGRRPRGRRPLPPEKVRRRLCTVHGNAADEAILLAKASQSGHDLHDYLLAVGLQGHVLDIRSILALDSDIRSIDEALQLLARVHPGEVSRRALASFLSVSKRLVRAQLSPDISDYLVPVVDETDTNDADGMHDIDAQVAAFLISGEGENDAELPLNLEPD